MTEQGGREAPQSGPGAPSQWKVAERLVDDTRRVRLTIAEVELPDGVRFEQYVMRLPRAAVVAVLDDRDRVLMVRRHRFVIDRWVWELPGGYVDDGEDPAATAAREVEEETGWRPGTLTRLLSFQPMVGSVDSLNELFLGRDPVLVRSGADINEAAQVAWIPLDSATQMTAEGAIVGSASIIGLLQLRTISR